MHSLLIPAARSIFWLQIRDEGAWRREAVDMEQLAGMDKNLAKKDRMLA
jgi:hypothetical protein